MAGRSGAWTRQSHAKTLKRYAKRNRSSWGKSKGRHYIDVPEGKRALDLFLDAVAQRLAATPPPGNLAAAVNQLDPHTLAFAALTPLLDAVARGWTGADRATAISDLGLQIGEQLRDRLALAGALASDSQVSRHTAEMIISNPESHKGRRIRGKLRKLLESEDPAERATATHGVIRAGQGILCFPPGRLGTELRRRVKARAEIPQEIAISPHLPADYDGLIKSPDKVDRAIGYQRRRQHKRDLEAIKRETADARWVTKQNGPCYLSYSLDRRGRVYANQYLNFGGGDHIRALFKFERGMPIGANGIVWLEIHCANSFGEVDKAPWVKRIEWTREHRPMIERVAAAPAAEFEFTPRA
jgi:hypothetical protein